MIANLLAAAAFLANQLPPAPIVPIAGSPQRVMLAWLPGEARCGGAIVAGNPVRRPWLAMLWSANPGLTTIRYGFTIATDGRPLGIHRIADSEYVPYADDIAPSLAATRFAAGAARADCTIAYTPRQTSLAETPMPDLLSYTINPQSGALPEEGWARIRGSGNCAASPRSEPLVQVFPAFRSLPATPGVRDWTLVGYDLDAKGKPTSVHGVAGTGNAVLEAAAIKAMAASRFTAGARRGCLYPFWRAAETLPAPPLPEAITSRPAGATCPDRHEWSVQPALRYPEPYRRRSIEGWAVLSYDVAPWGEVGNVKVVATEPTADFGTQAIEVVRSAKVPTTQGLVGCVDRVRFRMPDTAAAPANGAAGVPPAF